MQILHIIVTLQVRFYLSKNMLFLILMIKDMSKLLQDV